ACRPGGHPHHAAGGRLGLSFRPADQRDRCACLAAAPEGGQAVPDRADPHRAQRRLHAARRGRVNLLATAATAGPAQPPGPAALRRVPEPAPGSVEERRPVGRSPDLLHSAGFRFAMVYAGLLAVSAAVLAFYLWWATAGLLDRQTEAAIRADAQGLSERWAEGGLPALMLTIRQRLEQDVDDDALYLLVDPNLQPLAGNLRGWPDLVGRPDQLYELAVTRAGARTLAQVQRYDLPGGYHLLIGRDVQTRVGLRTLLADALLW